MTKLTLNDLTTGVLAPWFEKPPAADAVCSSPRDAAVRAVLSAVNASKPGVVRVAAGDATLARQCREFVVEFFGTAKLKPLFQKATGDTVELKSGVVIQIDSSSAKLSQGAIAVIELVEAASSQVAVEWNTGELLRQLDWAVDHDDTATLAALADGFTRFTGELVTADDLVEAVRAHNATLATKPATFVAAGPSPLANVPADAVKPTPAPTAYYTPQENAEFDRRKREADGR
jgi:hypothetical protein